MDADKPTRTAPQIEVVDGVDLLAAAAAADVRVRPDGRPVPPVRRLELTVGTGSENGAPVHLLTARIRFAPGRTGVELLGPDPISNSPSSIAVGCPTLNVTFIPGTSGVPPPGCWSMMRPREGSRTPGSTNSSVATPQRSRTSGNSDSGYPT